MKKGPPPLLLPLHIVIAGFFIILFVGFGATLGWYNFAETSTMLKQASEQVFDQVQQELSLDYHGTYKPVATAITIIGSTGLVHATDLQQRLQYLPLMQAALAEEKHLSGLEIGYPNGDYFIARPLRRSFMRERFSAPSGTTLVVDNIEPGKDGKRYLERIWFNQHLKEIKRSPRSLTTYDPRVRPWFTGAVGKAGVTGTDPYLFYFIDEVGFTLSHSVQQTGAVVAGDVTLMQLSETLSRHQMTTRTELIVLSEDGVVVAYQKPQVFKKSTQSRQQQLTTIDDLQSDVLTYAQQHIDFNREVVDFSFEGERWLGGVRPLRNLLREDHYFLAIFSPENELLADARAVRTKSALLTLLLIILTGPVAWLLARIITTPLRDLTLRVKRISNFDFSPQQARPSSIQEVNDLSQIMDMMQVTISQFTQLINSLASEQDFDALLETITSETREICKADAAVAYLADEDGKQLDPMIICDGKGSFHQLGTEGAIPLGVQGQENVLDRVMGEGLMEVSTITVEQKGIFTPVLLTLDKKMMNVFMLPLRNRQGEGVGVLCIFYDLSGPAGDDIDKEHIAFAEAISGFAAVTLESRKMLKMQKELLESFIKLLASAIDAKSPYTGGHCQRVPVLTKMLAAKACEAKNGPFNSFALTAEQWEELHIASWLHDCGKVTTPEYVVDKATKLETLYDRIHEVRMRFEVLKRDAHIAALQAACSPEQKEQCERQAATVWKELDEEFAFVAACNQGGEFLADEDIKRLHTIGQRTWQRTLDDRLGIAWEELRRKQRTPAAALPVTEHLLADKDEHLVERTTRQQIRPEDDYGFKVETPAYLYNRGELYNLAVKRGTLTAEERYQINDHIVQTIIMLKKLPYPKHLHNVPDIAGGHHEKIDGNGYPRRLRGDQLSMRARMMAVADIFEALTASDRPYKKAKSLSEAIEIMSFMEQNRHIDSDLFKLFLTSGVYLEYAEQYLLPEQIDSVDITQYL